VQEVAEDEPPLTWIVDGGQGRLSAVPIRGSMAPAKPAAAPINSLLCIMLHLK